MPDSEHFKKILLQLKNDMSQRIQAIDKDIRHEDMTADWTEQATERENDEVLNSLGNASEAELQMINFALQRLEKGEYFNCSKCGEEISTQRLEHVPYTSECVSCADKNQA